MNRLTEHITYLVAHHDCVIVPGFGALISQRNPATFDPATNSFMPPQRRVSFNATISGQDGLLAMSISRREGITYSRAVDAVSAEVDTLRHQLEHDGEVVIPQVGIFKRAEGGATPGFEPAAHCVANSAYAWLPATDDNPDADAAAPAAATTIAITPTPFITIRRFIPTVASVAAILAVVLGISFATLRPGDTTGNTDYASMSPTTPRPAQIITDDLRTTSDLFIYMPADPEASVTVVPATADVATESTLSKSATPRYCLVVASLPSRRQAEDYIASQHDSRLEILHSDGRYRVYVAGGSTYDAAYACKAGVSSRYPDAWVCER